MSGKPTTTKKLQILFINEIYSIRNYLCILCADDKVKDSKYTELTKFAALIELIS